MAVDFLLVDLQLSFRRAEEFQQLLQERRRTLQDGFAAIGNPETAQGFIPALDKGILEVERVRLELRAIWPRVSTLRYRLQYRVQIGHWP